MEFRQLPNILRLGPRVPVPAAEPDSIGIMDSIMNIAVPNRLVEPRSAATTTSAAFTSSTCKPNDDSAQCQKPVNQSTLTLPIILGVALPLIGAAVAFVILHRRNVRKQRAEDADERHARMDFGLGEVPGRSKGGPSRSSEMDFGEKDPRRPRQVSMDMTMNNSPYLLPPELQNSRESLHSLSRTIHQREDPYRGVAFVTGDGASIRSHSRQGGPDASSIYTGSSAAPSRMQDIGADLLGNASGMARSSPPKAFVPPPRQNSLPQAAPPEVAPAQQLSENPLPPYPMEPPQVYVPEASVAQAIPRKGLPTTPRPGQTAFPAQPAVASDRDVPASSNEWAMKHGSTHSDDGSGFRVDFGPPEPPARAPERELLAPNNPRNSPPTNSLPSSPRPPRQDPVPSFQPAHQSTEYENSHDAYHVSPPSPPQNYSEPVRAQRHSMDVPREEFAEQGLSAPGFDPRRLSIGFRPLPPGELTEVDDPEIRANRIRSFYKEYFDEAKPQPQAQYYEDYDENYLGDAAYYDPNTNNFVMPYAQPVTRRAMTPPPGGQRYQGNYQGPPRGMHGSMGAMSMNGMREPQMYPPGPYPQGPRAFSTASGGNRRQGPQAPRRPMPPPAALNTLPTPGKLRDDSFALMGATDFAPPRTYRDRAAGRSESPLGERRPYEQRVPAFAPLQSAFEELPAVPSPHSLRKSGTFTGLDFAPPKRFKDPGDTMSDAGSIRSNRSGVSAVQLGAIRNGAYRVSRIPHDVVFAKDDTASSLRPQWGMRAGS